MERREVSIIIEVLRLVNGPLIRIKFRSRGFRVYVTLFRFRVPRSYEIFITIIAQFSNSFDDLFKKNI